MSAPARPEARAFVNPAADAPAPANDAGGQRSLSPAGFDAALAEISSWPGYAPTPLVALPGLAQQLGLGQVLYKDERSRFGLGSFKALGGAYAVANVLRRKVMAAQGLRRSVHESCCRALSPTRSAPPGAQNCSAVAA